MSQAVVSAEVQLTGGEKDAEVTTALPLPRCRPGRHCVRATAPSAVSPRGRARRGDTAGCARCYFGGWSSHSCGSLARVTFTCCTYKHRKTPCVVACMNFAGRLFLCLDEQFAH